jgi:HD-GYP domain-containing protein (c-di-GMP phosphodiesterase class II)
MARILLIGPERDRASGVRTLLRQERHHVTWSRAVSRWREEERDQRPDLIVAAVRSPDELFAVGGSPPAGFPPPLLLVQQESDFSSDVYVEERLVDRLSSPFMEADLKGRVDALIRVRNVVQRTAPTRPRAEGRRPGGVARFVSWLQGDTAEDDRPNVPYLEVAARLADWSDRRDTFKPGHAERVTAFCAMIAEGLGLEEAETAELLRASMLHDIGKVALPIEVLRKPGPLEEPQLRLIRTHPARGAALLRALDPDDRVARVVLYHHERPDGTGYYGKPAESVPRASFVLSVAEAYDAMTSSLVREPLTAEYALEHLQSRKGSAYQQDCVEALADQLKPRAVCIPLSEVPLHRGVLS